MDRVLHVFLPYTRVPFYRRWMFGSLLTLDGTVVGLEPLKVGDLDTLYVKK